MGLGWGKEVAGVGEAEGGRNQYIHFILTSGRLFSISDILCHKELIVRMFIQMKQMRRVIGASLLSHTIKAQIVRVFLAAPSRVKHQDKH
jgi:hypothetical protein